MAGLRDITSTLQTRGKKGERVKAKNFVFAKILFEYFSSSSIAAKMIISEIVSQFYEYLHSHEACTIVAVQEFL